MISVHAVHEHEGHQLAFTAWPSIMAVEELGWIRSETVRPHDGGRPSVWLHINPRLVGKRA